MRCFTQLLIQLKNFHQFLKLFLCHSNSFSFWLGHLHSIAYYTSLFFWRVYCIPSRLFDGQAYPTLQRFLLRFIYYQWLLPLSHIFLDPTGHLSSTERTVTFLFCWRVTILSTSWSGYTFLIYPWKANHFLFTGVVI